MAAVFGLGDPVPGVGPYEQAAGDMHALQGAPVLQGIADGHAEVALADAEQHGRLPIGGVGDGALVAPDGAACPRRASVGHFTAVDAVAGAPLSAEIDFAGMADDALVAGGGSFDPVGQMSAVTRAGRTEFRGIDEG